MSFLQSFFSLDLIMACAQPTGAWDLRVLLVGYHSRRTDFQNNSRRFSKSMLITALQVLCALCASETESHAIICSRAREGVSSGRTWQQKGIAQGSISVEDLPTQSRVLTKDCGDQVQSHEDRLAADHTKSTLGASSISTNLTREARFFCHDQVLPFVHQSFLFECAPILSSPALVSLKLYT